MFYLPKGVRFAYNPNKKNRFPDEKIDEPKQMRTKGQYEMDYITCNNSSHSLDLKNVWVRAGKPAKKQMSMCFAIDKTGFYGSGGDIGSISGSISNVSFHMDENKRDIKQISVTNRQKQKYRVTQQDREHFAKELEVNYKRTENFKIPSGYTIVGVRVPQKADLYSNESAPICDVIIMKEHGQPLSIPSKKALAQAYKSQSVPKVVSPSRNGANQASIMKMSPKHLSKTINSL